MSSVSKKGVGVWRGKALNGRGQLQPLVSFQVSVTVGVEATEQLRQAAGFLLSSSREPTHLSAPPMMQSFGTTSQVGNPTSPGVLRSALPLEAWESESPAWRSFSHSLTCSPSLIAELKAGPPSARQVYTAERCPSFLTEPHASVWPLLTPSLPF